MVGLEKPLVENHNVIKCYKCVGTENIDLWDSKKMILKDSSLWNYLYKLIQFRVEK